MKPHQILIHRRPLKEQYSSNKIAIRPIYIVIRGERLKWLTLYDIFTR